MNIRDVPTELDRVAEAYRGDRLRLTLLQAVKEASLAPQDLFLASAVTQLLALEGLGCDLGTIAVRLAEDFAVERRRQETTHA